MKIILPAGSHGLSLLQEERLCLAGRTSLKEKFPHFPQYNLDTCLLETKHDSTAGPALQLPRVKQPLCYTMSRGRTAFPLLGT